MMQQPLQITFRDIKPSSNVEAYLREKVNKLEQFYNPIIACHAIIEQTQKHQHQGKLYNVRIHVSIPDKQIHAIHNENENLYTSMQRALDDTKKQLHEYNDKLHKHVKIHPERLHGEVARLFSDDEFGFIIDDWGNEYYFNSNTLHNSSFQRLKIGDKVHFINMIGEEGPQAHRVCLMQH